MRLRPWESSHTFLDWEVTFKIPHAFGKASIFYRKKGAPQDEVYVLPPTLGHGLHDTDEFLGPFTMDEALGVAAILNQQGEP